MTAFSRACRVVRRARLPGSGDFLIKNVSRCLFDEDLRMRVGEHLHSAPAHLWHYLRGCIPRGGSVCLLYPKEVLRSFAGRFASYADVFVVGDLELAVKLGQGGCGPFDVVLGEPAAFCEHGVLVHPKESSFWSRDVLAVASLLQFSKPGPASYDLVEAKRLVCESGVLDLIDAKKEAVRSFPFLI